MSRRFRFLHHVIKPIVLNALIYSHRVLRDEVSDHALEDDEIKNKESKRIFRAINRSIENFKSHDKQIVEGKVKDYMIMARDILIHVIDDDQYCRDFMVNTIDEYNKIIKEGF